MTPSLQGHWPLRWLQVLPVEPTGWQSQPKNKQTPYSKRELIQNVTNWEIIYLNEHQNEMNFHEFEFCHFINKVFLFSGERFYSQIHCDSLSHQIKKVNECTINARCFQFAEKKWMTLTFANLAMIERFRIIAIESFTAIMTISSCCVMLTIITHTARHPTGQLVQFQIETTTTRMPITLTHYKNKTYNSLIN